MKACRKVIKNVRREVEASESSADGPEQSVSSTVRTQNDAWLSIALS